MNRLPSIRTLAGMSDGNRWSTLSAFARDVRAEIDAINEGSVWSSTGTPLSRYRREAGRRLKRVYTAADHFGDLVGQPDKGGQSEEEAPSESLSRIQVCQTITAATRAAARAQPERAMEFHFALGFCLGFILSETELAEYNDV